MNLSFVKKLLDVDNPKSITHRLRNERFRLFQDLTERYDRRVTVLDVGGSPYFWERRLTDNLEVTVVNIDRFESDRVRCLVGDATNLVAFESKSYDFVFSTSVIEHVGDFEQQRRMANEVRRIGRNYYLQTPYRYFPIEPHFLVPFFQFFPLALRAWLVQHFNLGWMKRAASYQAALDENRNIQLLTAKDMQRLFPDAELYHEKFLGLTKSLTAIYALPAQDSP